MRPSTYWYDEQWGRAARAEAHCRRASCDAVNDLVLQEDGSFLCSKDDAVERARNDQREVVPCP